MAGHRSWCLSKTVRSVMAGSKLASETCDHMCSSLQPYVPYAGGGGGQQVSERYLVRNDSESQRQLVGETGRRVVDRQQHPQHLGSHRRWDRRLWRLLTRAPAAVSGWAPCGPAPPPGMPGGAQTPGAPEEAGAAFGHRRGWGGGGGTLTMLRARPAVRRATRASPR